MSEYRIFTLETVGLFQPQSFIKENDSLYYDIITKGLFNKNFEFHRNGEIQMQLEIFQAIFKQEVLISQMGELKTRFTPDTFSNDLSISSHYGIYHIVKDSMLSSSYTISNSTTEVVKISSKGLLHKQYGIAIQANEQIDFLLGLCFYIIYRIKKQEQSS